jgi:hypothetical protein
VRRTQPGVYPKVIALVLPREHHKVEQTNVVSNLSDEELAAIVEYLQQRIARQAKLIEGKALDAAPERRVDPQSHIRLAAPVEARRVVGDEPAHRGDPCRDGSLK